MCDRASGDVGWGTDAPGRGARRPLPDVRRTLAVAGQVRGFMPEPEGMALFEAGRRAAASRLGPLLEIGSYCGRSAVYLGAAAREGATVLFSVDHHRGSEELQAGWEHHDPSLVDPDSGRMDTLGAFRRTIERADLEDTVIGVVGDSATVGRLWRTPLALLFIDGGHGADVAWADYRAWVPHLAVGGLLAIHDVFAHPAEGGRAPYELYLTALGSGAFVQGSAEGSLRVLRRTGDGS